MCGRYRLSRRKQLVEEYFGSARDEQEWEPRYNIAPTQPVAVIRQNPKEPIRQLSFMRWGLSGVLRFYRTAHQECSSRANANCPSNSAARHGVENSSELELALRMSILMSTVPHRYTCSC